jgi:hypothetical protein
LALPPDTAQRSQRAARRKRRGRRELDTASTVRRYSSSAAIVSGLRAENGLMISVLSVTVTTLLV